MALEVADLGKSPLSADSPAAFATAFSKIRFVAGLDDEEGLEFFNGLYHATVLSKDDGDWSRVEQFIEDWETKLVSRARPNALRYESSPWTPMKKPLSEARVALITTGGMYIKDSQEPYDPSSDPSFREIPISTPSSAFDIRHGHYDDSLAREDINVIFPYERVKELAADGVIGSFAETAYAFMGFIIRDDVEKLINETAPEVARRLVADGVDVVLIGTT